MQLHPHDRRVVVRGDPFNAEAPFEALDSFITPIDDFYVRSNFPVPPIEPGTWELTVDGRVARSLRFSLDDLEARTQRTVACTLECAGNNRTRLAPIPEGEPWGLGAISTGTFTGVSLAELLDEAGVDPEAVEVRFEGADRGTPRGQIPEISFERSLPIDIARRDDILLVLGMNDAPLTPDHGAPVRLLVPGWYGMASVKWLRRIEVLGHALEAHFQTRQYRFHELTGSTDDQPAPPVTAIRVNSMITNIGSGGSLLPGGHEILGVAWSGDAPIAAVEVSADAGPWTPATLIGEAVPFVWRQWRFDWAGAPVGRHSLRTRATAADGSIQPDRPDWNRLGYGNNAVAVTLVEIVAEV